MRQLNGQEIEQISGGSLFGLEGFLGDFGAGIGGFVDSVTSWLGVPTNISESGTLLGSGLGKLVGLEIVGGIDDIGQGIISLIDNGLNAMKQVFGY
ncbi:hypothetical protein ACFSFZ_20790 [Mixta tenebrionis]|uniref:Uncharacterized protein n=1 Tax=Mixta tenebrionis TaxID=2562439 RepID=A0A506V5Q7_9GAMM|nr:MULTISPECIES: hypothetical protein [Mixta]QHM78028.1 hypothetical protein C7M52_04059 [Mixta theicola]TPW41007.1 hypothetical protein FKM52_16060 [Mixta tenebrionis]